MQLQRWRFAPHSGWSSSTGIAPSAIVIRSCRWSGALRSSVLIYESGESLEEPGFV